MIAVWIWESLGLELTYNYGVENYEVGTGLTHIAVAVENPKAGWVGYFVVPLSCNQDVTANTRASSRRARQKFLVSLQPSASGGSGDGSVHGISGGKLAAQPPKAI